MTKTINLQKAVRLSSRMPYNKNSFAYGLNFYKLTWLFVIGGLLGYIIETTWILALTGEFVNNQGLIYMPIKPVYAFGAILFAVLGEKIISFNGIFIFLICSFLGALFEFLCSVFQEYFLGKSFWDYSDSPFNIQGRTNLFYAILWGTLGLIFIRHIYPFICRILQKIPNRFGKTITWIIFIFLIANITLSVCAIKRQTNRSYGISAQNSFAEFLDKYYNDDKLSKIYNSMVTL